MARSHFLLAALGLVTLGADCGKEVGDPTHHGAYIAFDTDSGYTYRDDTMGLSDTLRVGLRITENDDDIRTLLVDVSYNGATPVRKDSLHIPSAVFDHDCTLIMRDQAGTEKWTFTVQEYNGDRVLRSLLFHVQ